MYLMKDQQAPQSAEGEAKVITLCGSTKFGKVDAAGLEQWYELSALPEVPLCHNVRRFHM